MSRIITAGECDQSVRIRMIDVKTGYPRGTLTPIDSMIFFYNRDCEAVIPFRFVELAEADDPYEEGGIIHLGAGYWRIDPPDEAFYSGTTGVFIFGESPTVVVQGAYHPIVIGSVPPRPSTRSKNEDPLPPPHNDLLPGVTREDAKLRLDRVNSELAQLRIQFNADPKDNRLLAAVRRKKAEIAALEKRARGLG
jgi:hypothetical protein